MKFELKDSIRWLDVGHKMVLQVRRMVFTLEGSPGQGTWDEEWIDVPTVLPWQSAQQSVQPTPESGGDFPAVESNSIGSEPAKSG